MILTTEIDRCCSRANPDRFAATEFSVSDWVNRVAMGSASKFSHELLALGFILLALSGFSGTAGAQTEQLCHGWLNPAEDGAFSADGSDSYPQIQGAIEYISTAITVQPQISSRELLDSVDATTVLEGTDRVTVVADIVGGPGFGKIIDVLDRGGRYTCSGAIAGPIVDLDLRTLYLRDLTFTGSTVVPIDIFPNVITYIERGEIKPLLAATYPLEELKTAQQAFMDKTHTGNIVVTMD